MDKPRMTHKLTGYETARFQNGLAGLGNYRARAMQIAVHEFTQRGHSIDAAIAIAKSRFGF